MIALAAVGDANDPATFGGTPFHILEAGRALGVVGRGLALGTVARRWRRRRLLWSAARMLRRGEHGGFQYSETFLDALWAQDPPGRGEAVVHLGQLYPERLFRRHDGALWFYVDQTLLQLFAGYGVRVGPRMRACAVRRERAQYHAAAGVIVRSEWAAESVRRDYGVPPERVHVVRGAANLDRAALLAHDAAPPPARDGPLRLVFVGKDWRRKGLDRLVAGLAQARAAGADAELLVVGVDPATLPPALRDAPGVTHAGLVDKGRDPRRFVALVGGCDVGCLLSRAEAGGLSLREFGRLGLVTVGPAVGGAPEYVVPGASHLVRPEADAAEIGALLHRLATEPGLLGRERAVAWAAREAASWDHAVRTLAAITGGRVAAGPI